MCLPHVAGSCKGSEAMARGLTRQLCGLDSPMWNGQTMARATALYSLPLCSQGALDAHLHSPSLYASNANALFLYSCSLEWTGGALRGGLGQGVGPGASQGRSSVCSDGMHEGSSCGLPSGWREPSWDCAIATTHTDAATLPTGQPRLTEVHDKSGRHGVCVYEKF